MMNRYIIASAGSGKTRLIVKESLENRESKILITTFTNANEKEITNKVIDICGYVPKNILIRPWVSFLLEHGLRPYQSALNDKLHDKRIGYHHIDGGQSGVKYISSKGPVYFKEETEFIQHYFDKRYNIYSDKLSKFIVKTNKITGGKIIARLSNIFQYIFVDEVQDLSGYDFDLLALILKSPSTTTLVGDPRQAIFKTSDNPKNKKYFGDLSLYIHEFKLSKVVKIEPDLLLECHRCHSDIIDFASKLFPELPQTKSCTCCRHKIHNNEHAGIFLIKKEHVNEYLQKYKPQVLRYSGSKNSELNFGECKGLGFERILIYSTEKIREYLLNAEMLDGLIRKKFYVALSRAVFSAVIVVAETENKFGIPNFDFQ